ncbi:T9SS type A sorting domain-containing protein, partial [Psychroflexus maritimus]
NDVTITANQGSCEAIDVELGNPVAQSCLNFEVENNAPEVFPLGTTQVTWTLTDENGQIISAQQNVTVTLEVDNASLCYVTSDEEQTTKNRIFINNFGGDNVLQYDILREVSTNNFQLIGSIEDPNENSFLDETSNNLSQSYAYRIRTISICNTQDNNLITHQTVLLQSSVAVNNSVNLNWSSYNGLNYDAYNIYRKVDNGNFEFLATVSSSTQSYNDVTANVTTSTYEYYISISAPDCSDSQSQDKTSFSSAEIKSNIRNTSNLNVLTHTADLGVSIYPNPSSNEINIAINDAIPFLKAEIFDLSGKLVLSSKKKSILIKDLPSSSYIIKLYTQQGNASKVFIKK